MTMIIDGTNGLTFNNSTTQASAGVVLQVVSTTYSTQTTTTSTSFVDSGLSLAITPKFATSKILIMTNGVCDWNRVLTNIDSGFGVQLVRGSTAIYTYEISSYLFITGASSGNDIYSSFSMSFLDSPATTSSTTYKLQFKTNTGTVKIQADSTPSSIILMEIAA
jgi:hypothetical protein